MSIFREETNIGRLMHIETDPNSQYVAYVWFDYNLNLMRNLQEGDFLCIQSFASTKSENHYVILQIVNKMPRHYALPTDMKGYPGFLMEAAKSASEDWTSQIEKSEEDTTKIICEAIPINMGFYLKDSEDETKKSLQESYDLPMPGKEVKILSYDFMEFILNKGLNPRLEGVAKIGTLQHNKDIDIYINIENLIRLHFGIFGFTGAGKSNLISTLIDKVMENSPEGTKLVVFDIMGEYLTLLIDLLIKYPDSKIIGVGAETFVGGLYEYYNGNKSVDEAVDTIVKTNLYPKRLLPLKEKFKEPFKKLIERKAFRIYEEVVKEMNKTIKQVIIEAGGIQGSKEDKDRIEKIYNKYKDHKVKDKGSDFIRELESLGFTETSNAGKFVKQIKPKLLVKDNLLDISIGLYISIPELVKELNDTNKKAIYIIQSHDPDELKKFVNYLSNAIYENRRKTGTIIPLVSFILDEADEFIPQDNYTKGESKTSRQAVEMLARRGRKFGLGIGIATQRVVYLDTNIIAQPHTYFISKLPRSSDRERVAEAFAIGENIFKQTFRFGKGDWLLVSHDATGLEATPFPIHTDNAEERIIKFLKEYEVELK